MDAQTANFRSMVPQETSFAAFRLVADEKHRVVPVGQPMLEVVQDPPAAQGDTPSDRDERV
jgi:hypothetical protein